MKSKEFISHYYPEREQDYSEYSGYLEGVLANPLLLIPIQTLLWENAKKR
ncbi:hypothetical protein ACQKML_13895 [Peribacillus frigoritolerans]